MVKQVRNNGNSNKPSALAILLDLDSYFHTNFLRVWKTLWKHRFYIISYQKYNNFGFGYLKTLKLKIILFAVCGATLCAGGGREGRGRRHDQRGQEERGAAEPRGGGQQRPRQHRQQRQQGAGEQQRRDEAGAAAAQQQAPATHREERDCEQSHGRRGRHSAGSQ